MTDRPGWTFCDNPECLLCATTSPRRDVPASQRFLLPTPSRWAGKTAMDVEDDVVAAARAVGMVARPARNRRRVRIYFEPRDVWIGAYVAKGAVYVCPLPCLVIRWQRR